MYFSAGLPAIACSRYMGSCWRITWLIVVTPVTDCSWISRSVFEVGDCNMTKVDKFTKV